MMCPNCGNPITQTISKRPKKFCNTTCRSNFWQKEKRKKAVAKPAKKTPAKSAKSKKTILPKPVAVNQFEVPAVVYERKGVLIIKENPIIIDYPVDFRDLLAIAKSANMLDVSAFKKHVQEAKLSQGQKDQIYSKLK